MASVGPAQVRDRAGPKAAWALVAVNRPASKAASAVGARVGGSVGGASSIWECGAGPKAAGRWQGEPEPKMGCLRRLCWQEGPELEQASAGQARSGGKAGPKALRNVSDQIQQCLENLGFWNQLCVQAGSMT